MIIEAAKRIWYQLYVQTCPWLVLTSELIRGTGQAGGGWGDVGATCRQAAHSGAFQAFVYHCVEAFQVLAPLPVQMVPLPETPRYHNSKPLNTVVTHA